MSKVDMAIGEIERFEPAADTHTHGLIDSRRRCKRMRRKAQARGWDVSGRLKSNRSKRLIAEDGSRTWQSLARSAAQLTTDDWQEVVWPSEQGDQTMYPHLIRTWIRKIGPTLLLVTCHDRAEPLKTVRYWGSTMMDLCSGDGEHAGQAMGHRDLFECDKDLLGSDHYQVMTAQAIIRFWTFSWRNSGLPLQN